jgi:polysaccharide pyruvyl transferase WcaK-like protein
MSKHINIVLIGARLNNNLGGPSLYVSTVKAIRETYPEARIQLLVPASEFVKEQKIKHLYNVDLMPLEENAMVLGGLCWRVTRIFPFRKYKNIHIALMEADLILDIWGIMFTDYLGKNTAINRFREGLRLMLGRIYSTSLIKATAAMGPFNQIWNRRFATFYLHRFVDHIVARDETTYGELKKLGLGSKLTMTADTAFLLEPEEMTQEFDDPKLPNIVISVSHQARNRSQAASYYLEVMKNFIQYLVTQVGVTVTLLPNEIEESQNDDLKIAEEIQRNVNHPACHLVDPRLLSASQIKGIIDHSEVVVASRYHTVIAALSLGKPTISIGWHHKYEGVLQLFGLEDYSIPVDKLDLEILKNSFDKIWASRVALSLTLNQTSSDIRNDILAIFKNIFEKFEKLHS